MRFNSACVSAHPRVISALKTCNAFMHRGRQSLSDQGSYLVSEGKGIVKSYVGQERERGPLSIEIEGTGEKYFC